MELSNWLSCSYEKNRRTIRLVMARKSVKAPAGFHWMKKGNNNYKLMKHTGKFKSHRGASLTASFDVQKVHKTATKKKK
jgi:hypothetical protein